MDLGSKHCVPCEGGDDPLTREKAEEYLKMVEGWKLDETAKEISKSYKFPNFKSALAFVNSVGDIAEAEGHHPDIELSWGRVGISLSTHAIKGLSENDFILAYKIDNQHVPS